MPNMVRPTTVEWPSQKSQKPDTVTITEHAIPNTICINRITVTPSPSAAGDTQTARVSNKTMGEADRRVEHEVPDEKDIPQNTTDAAGKPVIDKAEEGRRDMYNITTGSHNSTTPAARARARRIRNELTNGWEDTNQTDTADGNMNDRAGTMKTDKTDANMTDAAGAEKTVRVVANKTDTTQVNETATADQEKHPETDGEDDETNQYVVEWIMTHRKHGGQLQDRVRWYGYAKADDTYQPSHHIKPHFIAR